LHPTKVDGGPSSLFHDLAVPFRPKYPKRLRAKRPPTLHVADILAWADEHKERTGEFPMNKSGIVAASPLEKWANIDNVLYLGCRGFPGRWTLAKLLAERRGRPHQRQLPKFRLNTILKWADEHKERTGKFPTAKSGIVVECPSENWGNVSQSLHKGLRGLPGGMTIAQLLAERRGHRNRKRLPKYSLKQILEWADAHRKRAGRFPTSNSGPIRGTRGETWMAVEDALIKGTRGLPGGSSLAKLLAKRRGYRNLARLPALSLERILEWADLHKARTGNWPTPKSGPVVDGPGETWSSIQSALDAGCRGLRGGSSLARLLANRRGVRRHVRRPLLSIRKILRWADAHKKRTGRWPREASCSISEAPGETWGRVQAALVQGKRGMAGHSTLAKFLGKHRGARNIQDLPKLSERLILKWIAAHYRRHGKYLNRESGPVPQSDGTTWCAVTIALSHGRRGLPGGSSLARLIREHFPARKTKSAKARWLRE
jgi:hypothetical protein